MVEADSQLKLLPVSTLDTYTVFEHIDMLSVGIWQYPQTVIPTLLGSDFGVLAHLWSQNDVITSLLILTATSNCFTHPHYSYAKCLSASICCPWAYGSSLKKQLYPHYLGQILGFWLTCGVKMMSLCHGWGWQPPQTASHIHIRHIKVFEHIDMLSWVDGSSLKQLYSHYLGQMLGFWFTCGVNMISLYHGWVWQQPQTASHINIRHIQCV